MRILLALVLAGLTTFPQDKKKTDGVLPPEEWARTFTAMPGLEMTIWATEPGFSNPTCMDIDERGRVWVAESVNYRGSKLRPAGDRIMILEDTDLDGKCDSYKVFVQDPAIIGPLGLCVLGNKVYVAQSPKMLVYTIDASGDKAVGTPEVLFDGFRGVNHDHGLHSIMFGPDGRFYFNAGNDGCNGAMVVNGKGEPIVDSHGSHVGGKGQIWRGGPRGGPGQRYRQGMAFRCNPDGSGFETLGQNFRNNYEVSSDSFGTAWQSDNDDDGNQGTRINYVMEGGDFGYVGWKDTSWGRDQGTYAGQLRQEAHFHQRDPGVVPNLVCTGAGSPTGILVYEGDLLPEVVRGSIIHCEPGHNVIRSFVPTPAGGGYKTATLEVLKSSHKWFRPADACVGVDGALYVADWTDPGVGGHATGDKDLAKISGRVYRVAPTGNKPEIPKIDLSTAKGQVAALLSPNLARRYLGYSKLAAGGADAVSTLKEVWTSSTNLRHRARAMWALSRLPGGADIVREALKDKSFELRIAGIRAARILGQDMVVLAREMIGDAHEFVARELCLALQYVPTAKCLDVLVALGDKVAPWSPELTPPPGDKTYHPASEQEKWRQEAYVNKWYLEAFGIACHGREADVLAAWQKDGKNKDAKVAATIAWRLNRVIPEAATPPKKEK
jgi:putative membrane-bound dehydrogenase-like protein